MKELLYEIDEKERALSSDPLRGSVDSSLLSD